MSGAVRYQVQLAVSTLVKDVTPSIGYKLSR